MNKFVELLIPEGVKSAPHMDQMIVDELYSSDRSTWHSRYVVS